MKCAVVHKVVHQSDVEDGMNFNPDLVLIYYHPNHLVS